MEIRRAKPQDAEKLSQIALAAKSYWNYPERLLVLWKKALTVTQEIILESEVYKLTRNGDIIGFYELIMTENSAGLEHLWINPEHVRSGIGGKLFAHDLERSASLKAKTLNIKSDPKAEGFYKKMGAKRIGEEVSEID